MRLKKKKKIQPQEDKPIKPIMALMRLKKPEQKFEEKKEFNSESLAYLKPDKIKEPEEKQPEKEPEKKPSKESIFTKHLPKKVFVFTMIAVLIIGLTSIFGLNYIFNIQYVTSTNPFNSGPVTTPPKSLRIDLEAPDDDLLVFDPSIIISGKTAPNNEILIFTDTQDFVLIAKPDGTFSTILELDEGVNRITAIVFDPVGDSRSAERTVFYSKEEI